MIITFVVECVSISLIINSLFSFVKQKSQLLHSESLLFSWPNNLLNISGFVVLVRQNISGDITMNSHRLTGTCFTNF